MKKPAVAVVAFPGMNCEVESLRAIRRCGMEAMYFRWNDDREKLKGVDGYFLPGGFSYEDRGRAGMVAARDPLLEFIGKEASEGKVVIGNCNGAQILVESGMIPLDTGLRMSLARNTRDGRAVGFLNHWVHITPACTRGRCATGDWEGVLAMPIAHGEGRFTTRDPELLGQLEETGQLAFRYCDSEGNVSDDPGITPNGSLLAIAGICNPTGNVVALMPHPERTLQGDPYFHSLKKWMQTHHEFSYETQPLQSHPELPMQQPGEVEIFIDTIITNNEERTVEQALRRFVPNVQLKQFRYIAPGNTSVDGVLRTLQIFNPNKELALIRRNGEFFRWDNSEKREEKLEESPLQNAHVFLQKDEPDTGAGEIGEGSSTGVCYVCRGVEQHTFEQPNVLEVLANPHASTLSRFS